jgi:HEPN domain-containing protein
MGALKSPEEWLRQADYDMETADSMFNTGRYIYVVFMCRLSLEKALKGLHLHKLGRIAPRTHDLLGLTAGVGIRPPEKTGRFLVKLNDAHIVTRYPEELATTERAYTQSVTQEFLQQSRAALEWIKTLF